MAWPSWVTLERTGNETSSFSGRKRRDDLTRSGEKQGRTLRFAENGLAILRIFYGRSVVGEPSANFAVLTSNLGL
jgi:hypothetical protein